MAPCPWHKVGVFGHRAKRARRNIHIQVTTIHILGSTFYILGPGLYYRAARPFGLIPPVLLEATFSLPLKAVLTVLANLDIL